MAGEAYYERKIYKLKKDLADQKDLNKQLVRENKDLNKKIKSFEEKEDRLKKLTTELRNSIKEVKAECDAAKKTVHDVLIAKARADKQLSIAINEIREQNEKLKKIEYFQVDQGDD